MRHAVLIKCVVSVMAVACPATATAQLVLGPGAGCPSLVHRVDAAGTTTVQAYDPRYLGGVNVALGDVNSDGVFDIITGPRLHSGPHVAVFSGTNLSLLASFYAYDPVFQGGVHVASGDVNGDGFADIITGSGPGGAPHVEVFSGRDLSLLASFLAYDPRFDGGVHVAAGDVNGDGFADIITGAGPGGGPHVEVFSGANLSLLASFFAYDPRFRGGVDVAGGDVNGDGLSDVITGAGPGGAPHVQVFSGANLGLLASFYAFDPGPSDGVRVAAGDLNGDGRVDLIMSAAQGGDPHVRIISGVDGRDLPGVIAPAMPCDVTVGSVGDGAGLRVTSAAATGFLVGTAGSFTVTTVGAPVPTLTVSGPLPTGVTFVDHGNGTATLSGTPAAGTGGIYPLTFTANNGRTPVTQAFTLTVTQAPAITSASATSLTIGAAGSFTVTATGFPLPTLTLGGVALPVGVTFVDNGNGTGTLSGTPAAGTGGTYALTVTAANTGGSVVQPLTFTVSGAPAITSAPTTIFTVGSAGTFTVTTIGTPTPAMTVSGTLPTGVTFTDNGDGTGTLSGTPAAGTGAIYALTFTATNGVLPNAVQNFALTIAEGPGFTSATSATLMVGTAGSFTVAATGEPDPSLTLGGGVLPAGVTLVDNGNGTAVLGGIPGAGTAGIYGLTFTASNGVGASVSQAFTLTVVDAPAFTSAAATTFASGVAGSFTVTTVGTPLATLSVGALPAGVTFVDNLNGTGTLSGTPTAGTAGTHTLTFTATNGVGAPVVQTFTLTITETSVITSASATTFAIGAVNTFTVTASGFPFPSLVQGGAALPSGVTFVDNGDGTATLSGTPAAGTGGTYALTFTATNGTGSAVQNFTLTVAGSPSFTSAATTTFTVGTPGTFTVTAIGAPAPALTVSGTLPAGVTFVDNGGGSGTLSGTPAAGTGGTYALTFTAANGVLPDGTQAFTLTINEGPAITSAATATFTIGLPGSFTVTTSGLPLPTLAIGGVALPAGVAFVDNGNGTGTLSGTPAAGTGGTYALSFTATNTIGASAPQAFTLTVNEAPAITSANTATFVVNVAGTTFQVVMTGFPAPTVSVTSGVLPAGLTLTSAGLLSGTPTQSGSFPVTLTATNGALPNATQAFTVVVNAAPAITSAAATTFTVGSAGSFNVVMTGFPTPTVSVTAGTLPAGVTLSPAGVLSGTPDPGTGGVHNVTFTATNGIGANAVQAFTLTVNQAPAITSAATTSFTVGVSDTFTVTTTGFPAPAITQTGVALPAGVTFADNGNGTGTLSGTPAAGTAGAYAFTFTATNSTPPSAVQAFTLNVNQPPAITSATTTTFTVGTPGSFTVTTTGFPAPTVAQTGALPAGVTFTPATRVLGGTATQTGTFSAIQFTATNGIPPDAVQTFTLNVVCPTITVTPLILAAGLFQTAYAPVDFNQTGSTGSSFTWSATGLIAGLSIDISTGIVSGTPTNTVLNGAVAITVTDNFGCTGTATTTLTVRPTADNENYTGGVGNTQYVVGVAPVPTTPHVLNLDSTNVNVKMGDNGPGTLEVTFPATSTNLGVIVEGGTDGTFIYTPAAGFTGLTDTFTYTLTDGNMVTNTATVTINLAGIVWYMNSSGGNGDGRSHNPFNSLANAAAPSLNTHAIYVHAGGATTPGNIALDANQTLHGAGATFNLNGLTIASGTRPTLSGTVTLANNDAVTAVNFAPLAGIPAMTGSGLTQAVAIDQVNVTGGTSAVSLTNVSGAVTVMNANFTNSTGAEVLINQGTGNVSIAAAISSNTGRSVDIQNRTGGTVNFMGPITDTGQGIFLNANTGSTINFTGGLSLGTTTNPGFTATGGGTVSATQNNTTIVNSITTTTGTAVNVANTTIGASGLTFQTISANGPTKGIILNTTGSGGFTVSGTGPAGTGGTIQNATSRGGEFISVNNVTLNDMNFNNNGIGGAVGQCGNALGATTTGTFVTDAGCLSNLHLQTITTAVLDGVTANDSDGHGINGYQITGLTLSNVSIERNGNEVGEDGVQLVNSSGTVTVNGTNMFRDNASNQFEAQNGTGTATLLVSGSFFGLTNFPTTGVAEPPSPGPGTANSGLLISGSGTANMTATVTGSTFDENYANGYLSDTAGSATMNITVGTAASGNTFTNNGVPIEIVNASTGSMTYVIRNNTITNNTAITGIFATTAIVGARSGAGSVMTGTIDDNNIGTPGTIDSGCFVSACDGISLPDSATSSTNVYHVTVTNNQINHVHGGIASNIGGIAVGEPRTSFVITGNTIQNPFATTQANAIAINSGTLPDNKPQTCAEISGYTISGAWGVPLNNDSLRLRHRGASTTPNPSTFRVRNWDGLNFATPGLENFLETANIFGAGTVDGFGFQLVGANLFTGGAAACPQ